MEGKSIHKLKHEINVFKALLSNLETRKGIRPDVSEERIQEVKKEYTEKIAQNEKEIKKLEDAYVPFCQCLHEIENKLKRTKYCFVPCSDQRLIIQRRNKK